MDKNFFKNLLIVSAIKTLKLFAGKIEFIPIRQFFTDLINKIDKALKVLTDGDASNDKEALAAFWEENKTAFSDVSLLQVAQLVYKKAGGDMAGQIAVQVLIELADRDGVPITPEIKAMFPLLAPFFDAENASVLGIIDGTAKTVKSLSAPTDGGETVKRTRRSRAEMEALRAIGEAPPKRSEAAATEQTPQAPAKEEIATNSTEQATTKKGGKKSAND